MEEREEARMQGSKEMPRRKLEISKDAKKKVRKKKVRGEWGLNGRGRASVGIP